MADSIQRRRRVSAVLIHLLVISILLVVPEMIMTFGTDSRHIPEEVYFKVLVYLAVFYINYYWIIPKTLGAQRHTWRFFVYNLLLVVVAMALLHLIFRLHLHGHPEAFQGPGPDHHRGGHHGPHHEMWAAWSRDAVMLVLIVGLSVALKLNDRWFQLRQRQQEIREIERREEIQRLKAQLNPHFLFNTLNAIYALIDLDPTRAKDALHELSSMLRYVVYDEPKGTVPLEIDLQFINSYIDLMRLRLSATYKINVRLDPGDMADARIAPMLFVTLVENCFKHGRVDPSIPITITITAHDGVVKCVTTNSFAPVAGTATPLAPTVDGTNHGVGMENLRRRLDLIYGDRACLTTSDDGRVFTASLTVNLPNNTNENG
ncbi:MAG: sensor histidine kinase [Bacteroidales bacterium]|nr:sensor histidine kinase [Bacteroidales bacterium]